MRTTSIFRKLVLLALGGLSLLLLFVLIPWTTNIRLSNGSYAKIRKASFLRSCLPEAFSTISYAPTNGKSGTIVLWQDVFDGPITLIPGTDTNVLLCLYDFDVDFRLFRIETDKPFTPLPSSCDLNRILFTCTWQISDGTSPDWDQMMAFLHNASSNHQTLDAASVGLRNHESPDSVLKSLSYQGRR